MGLGLMVGSRSAWRACQPRRRTPRQWSWWNTVGSERLLGSGVAGVWEWRG